MASAMSLDQPYPGRLEAGEHLLPARVYYEDTDFTGVVYHANYLSFFERGRSEFLRVMGPAAGRGADPGAFAVTHISIDFKAPARIHDALLVRTAFAGMKGPRLIFSQRAERGGVLLCQAEVVAVAIYPDGRARRPSLAELAHWERHKKPAAPGL